MKYSFSIANRFGEVLRVDDAHSFDEAVHQVEKGIYERDLEIARRLHAQGNQLPPDLHAKLSAAGELPEVPPLPDPAPEMPPQIPTATPPVKPDPEAPTMVQPLDADGNPLPPETLDQVKK